MAQTDLNSIIGEMGLYQWIVFGCVLLFSVFKVDSIHIIFIAADMGHWCRVEELDGLPYDVQKNVAIPAESSSDGSVEYSSCQMFALNYSVYNVTEFYSWNRSLMITNNTPRVQCQHWNYDQSVFESTIVSKFDLVCGSELWVQFASTIFMFGALLGSILSGYVSDRFGRKPTLLCFYALKITGVFMSIFGPVYAVFAAGRFLIGFGLVGYHLTEFVLVMELAGRRYRNGLGTAIQIAFSVGYMMQAGIAYALRDVLSYHLAAATPICIFPVIVLFVIPESPRWLAVHGKYDELTTLLRRICKINGRKLADDFQPQILLDKSENVAVKNCSALLISPTMRLRTLIIDFSWFTCALIYYALAFNTGSLHGNIYLNTFISGALEIPAYIICIFMMDWRRTGRRWTGCFGLVGAAVSSFISIPMIIFGYPTVTTALSLVGKALICITYSVVYVYANELFPTEVRNVGFGSASMTDRVASMSASYVGGPLSKVWQPLPSLLFGACAAVSGLLYVFLPETLGHVLPDTIEQAEQIGMDAHSSRWCPVQASISVTQTTIQTNIGKIQVHQEQFASRKDQESMSTTL